jgi:hypothetical protein
MYVMIIQHNHQNQFGVCVPARTRDFRAGPVATSNDTTNGSSVWPKKGESLSGMREERVRLQTTASVLT